jgi:hypothetical protein
MAVYIQLLGRVGSGKTFLANELAARKGGIVLSFAKDVYRLAAIVKGGRIDKSRREDRDLLKLIGTTWGRQARPVGREIQDILERHKPVEWGSPDIWARIFAANCRSLSGEISVFNDDTRFVNELQIAMSELSFIPIYVACTEHTRRERLRQRGDTFDPSATDHLSEEIANFLGAEVFSASLTPVVWNDPWAEPPSTGTQVYRTADFYALVDRCETNEQLASELNWTTERAHSLVRFLSEIETDSHV